MNILLIDDHPLFLGGISVILKDLAADVTIHTSGSCEEALELIQQDNSLDLILLDLNLPGISGADGIKEIRKLLPKTPLAVLSASEERAKILHVIEEGANGFIPKSSSADIIVSAVKLILSGGVFLPMAILDTVSAKDIQQNKGQEHNLTPRQLEVLKLLSDGLPNKSIANQLGMAENTVRIHVSAILKALDVSNRTEAGAVAMRLGLIGD